MPVLHCIGYPERESRISVATLVCLRLRQSLALRAKRADT
jgi:hypothetical protein